ncbi:uncharacterized protein MELLADRAFT_102336 [Melampsora larici-populina 98AG31]|uniref:Secreted protein n=1 Tax=Melampsora larici-populina (strain 98AG31 / pathotype 3-4-7) TaxID=747676 RepID=F4R7Y7_MELLP|nr:uncharacterized protein MELLADRAFT_102336 [Melampsora larici-populina 98AG31]EGG11706.1 hypothetical protein MELLADRAFT_102336 [Melampsora larici-populina 98AG31]
MISKSSRVSVLFFYFISLICLSATNLPRSFDVTPILSNTSFTNTTLTESNNTSTNVTTDPTILPIVSSNITDEITSPSSSNFLNASRLFTIQLTLSPALNPSNENQTIKSVRNVLNGTITGQSLNGTILGGISNSISQWSNSSSSSVSSPPLPSFFIWMLLNGKNSSVFITQSSLPSHNNDQRLGRLTVEFENGKQFSKSLILSTFGSQQNLTSFNFDDSLTFFIDAWKI